MALLQDFSSYVTRSFGLSPAARVLLAVSGGVDSMVMAELFRLKGYQITIAHCNFQLRGPESDGDENLVREYCKSNSIPFFVRHFNTTAESKLQKTGIQETARELRYNWFSELCREHDFDLVATAHHQGDVAETILINLTRGTGIAGLHGILPKSGNLIRPLLFTNRTAIRQFAEGHHVQWRDDSSNTGNDYTRNKIRNLVLPLLQEINPAIEETFTAFAGRMLFVEHTHRDHLRRLWEKVHEVQGGTIRVPADRLRSLAMPEYYLYEWLNPFGFNDRQASEIARSLAGKYKGGAAWYSNDFVVYRDRDGISVCHPTSESFKPVFLGRDDAKIDLPGGRWLHLEYRSAEGKPYNPGELVADASKLTFPLVLRPWQPGDRIRPLGMKGTRKVSDVLTDRKVDTRLKNQTYVVTSADRVVCIPGLLLSEDVKITPGTSEILLIRIK
jgi:tRNA(Ile)-lysidine synthase